LFDLTNRIRLDHKDRDAPFFSFNNWLKPVAVISALGYQDIGFLEILNHHCRNTKLPDRLNQTAARDTNRVDPLFTGDCDVTDTALLVADLVYLAIALGMLFVLSGCLPSIALEGSSLHVIAPTQGLRDCGHIWFGCLDDVNLPILVPVAFLWQHGITAQNRIHGAGYIPVDCHMLSIDNFDQNREGWR